MNNRVYVLKEQLELKVRDLQPEDIVDAFYDFIDAYYEDDRNTDEQNAMVEAYVATDHYGFLSSNEQQAFQIALTLQYTIEDENYAVYQIKIVMYFYPNDELRKEFPVISQSLQDILNEKMESGNFDRKEIWGIIREAQSERKKAKKNSMWLYTQKDFKKANKLFDRVFEMTKNEGYIGHTVLLFSLN